MKIVLKPLGIALILGSFVVLVAVLLVVWRQVPTASPAGAPPGASGPVAAAPVETRLPPTQQGITDWESKVGAQLDVMQVASPESENQHKIRGEKTEANRSPIDPAAKYRHAIDGGWFGFELKVHPQRQNLVVLRYWGDEPNLRVFDITVDGSTIATEKLLHNVAPKYYEVGYPIPATLTRGKGKVEVRLVGKTPPGATGWAGGIFLAKSYELK